ncbi:hypothetical protein COT72_05275 [archaeon CG10_big_fil_rev_8_21_14_0_10_43_11]|nr:MAG: hypothetical protein COT72_05275 [archaeon CG10_big_fil_rev_8_21_14_0_10_43_11]
MSSYLFVLGRNPQLSHLELETVYEKKPIHKSEKCVILELDKKPDIATLGGIVKICEIVDEIHYKGKKNAFYWGLSDYDKDGYGEALRKTLQKQFVKQKLKAIYKRESERPSVVNKYRLLDAVVCDGFLAKTIAAYNPDEVVQREEKKPVNDFMIASSARLARIMINISNAQKKDVLLDPFCGVGVVLQEATLKGLRVIGIEKDSLTAKKARRNLHWLKRGNWEIIEQNSTQLADHVMECDVVVSEPYMGEFLDKIPTKKQAHRIARGLEDLYARVFEQIAIVLKKGGRIVFVLPYFKTREGDVLRVSFKHPFFERARVAYEHEGTKIGREVVVFENVK